MFASIIYIILAIIGISFLIFVHELGHFIMAKIVGMKVETFSIGFGKPIYSFHRAGVKWQIGIFPFGGFVKIAGMQKEGGREPYEIKKGFFGKSPKDRILVSAMGPLFNILFAMIFFVIIWLFGGREEFFSSVTHKIGWVSSESALYQNSVRAGDQITTYGGRSFRGRQDLLLGSLVQIKGKVDGTLIDYRKGTKTPFAFEIKEPAIQAGVVPASSLHYVGGASLEGTPMASSGIKEGDRIIWADGFLIFSAFQLNSIVNMPLVFLTVERDGKFIQTMSSRHLIGDLPFNATEKAEIDDWRHDAGIDKRTDELYVLPYNLTVDGKIESKMDDDQFERRNSSFEPLKIDDRIVAVNGKRVSSSADILKEIQERRVLMVVSSKTFSNLSWKDADNRFEESFSIANLENLLPQIGIEANPNSGDLRLLNAVVPKRMEEIASFENQIAAARKEIENLKNSKEKEIATKELEESQKRFMLGIPFQDLKVRYNPNPFRLLSDVFSDTWFTLKSLVFGYASPKHLMGPIGIMQVMHYGFKEGFGEALNFLAIISVNLAVLNLLPLPFLDGGYILLSLIEAVTRRPLKAKTMERLILPFVVLLILAAIYVTYQDLLRLFSKYF